MENYSVRRTMKHVETNKPVSEEHKNEGSKTKYMKSKCAVIGKNIRELRKQMRLTVDDSAGYLDLSVSYIGLLERGDRCPSLKIVFKLCDLFGITPFELLTGKPDDHDESLNAIDNESVIKVKVISTLANTISDSQKDFIIETIKNLRSIGSRVV